RSRRRSSATRTPRGRAPTSDRLPASLVRRPAAPYERVADPLAPEDDGERVVGAAGAPELRLAVAPPRFEAPVGERLDGNVFAATADPGPDGRRRRGHRGREGKRQPRLGG